MSEQHFTYMRSWCRFCNMPCEGLMCKECEPHAVEYMYGMSEPPTGRWIKGLVLRMFAKKTKQRRSVSDAH